MDQGLKKIAIIHVNNDFGVNMVAEFKRAYEVLGGQITSLTPYNQGQASYAPEVTRGLEGDPPALYLVSYPGDGTAIACTWISQDGAAKFLLNDGMNSADFIRDVGPRYLNLVALQQEGRILHLGVTNFDTDHLRLLVKHGFPIVSNQVSFSLLDRRAAEDMSTFCLAAGVRLLAYGTLGGGFLTDRWVGVPEPTSVEDWSKSKYKRFIDTIGGWSALQTILAALHEVARKHGVSVVNVVTRWVLEQPAVAAVIVGARLGEREHRADNATLFSFSLDEDDKQ